MNLLSQKLFTSLLQLRSGHSSHPSYRASVTSITGSPVYHSQYPPAQFTVPNPALALQRPVSAVLACTVGAVL